MTGFAVGDKVRAERTTPGRGSWWRYAGREGWVAVINTQRFPNGRTYTEIGVTWIERADMVKAQADAWFKPDELVVLP